MSPFLFLTSTASSGNDSHSCVKNSSFLYIFNQLLDVFIESLLVLILNSK